MKCYCIAEKEAVLPLLGKWPLASAHYIDLDGGKVLLCCSADEAGCAKLEALPGLEVLGDVLTQRPISGPQAAALARLGILPSDKVLDLAEKVGRQNPLFRPSFL